MLAHAVPVLTPEVFAEVRELILGIAGIVLSHEKEELVKSRLASRLKQLRLSSYEQYLASAKTDRRELSNLVDVLTTNKTSFFREEHHFEFLQYQLFPSWAALGRPVRIWSAGCSTGEEPYSLAMLCRQHLPGCEVRILATDISLRVLKHAKAARYAEQQISAVPHTLRARFVRKPSRSDAEKLHEITEEARSMVSFARLNLLGDWPMRGQFDLILCRNVMIYFDDDTRTQLACRFAERLAPGAPLFIGHAESLGALTQPLQCIEPAVYRA
ncbi:MAG: protein-glutamate O-methyltransferase CheR [Myxococcota bacterium]|jgi:chemotaxis protein methyltransferase CheR|nr:protein-glutamate O-methyltransferase CheR [Myxococcota bacterium]